ncbi:hypothetical protein LTR62_003542 [Meristemomyces frigidus]|uniref:Uncharacterized protein n=1 Tax=Meristemomyces frigidus TaxID=1508187 RepID=A0AAN7TP29_9PEZI|nr:hypothetical protein LTR62_003542 [Meristemomyces frigidus]
MSRTQQDQFIDEEEEETCPLCVEELSLDDKNFKPCPCGYQICHFCWNNIKSTMNGLCPACRRPYNDENIQYKALSPEEIAAYKARQAQKTRRTQAVQLKEKQKAEADHLSRKHLSGMRVVQKNLVYVTGLNPTASEDQLLQTLRGDQYFGQYGKIVKIVVSKAKDPSHLQSVGVYVTYERKEDAQTCITLVNGSKNSDRTLRAQFGTTKYCSAYLRGETCTNKQCMFLHEPGEAGESFSRADLSALNAGSSQHGGSRPPPPQSQQPVASAAQPMERQVSDQSRSPTAERPALPSTASWASKPLQQPSRNESRSTSGATASPAPTKAAPAAELEPVVSSPPPAETIVAAPERSRPRKPKPVSPLMEILKNLSIDNFKFTFSMATLSEADAAIVANYPPLFDSNGGAKRRQRREREEEHRRMELEAQAFQQPSTEDEDDNPEMSGSLQLGGEPEERQSSTIRPPGQDAAGLDLRFQFGDVSSPALTEASLPQQQQAPVALLNQQAGLGQQPGNPPGHMRGTSRFSFANDTQSASTNVKPVASAKILSQQSSIMPGGFGGNPQSQQQFYTSNVQGPPPGLKTAGTPPVSGTMTFGQGHGFATGGLQYGIGPTSTTTGGRAGQQQGGSDEMIRNLMRGNRDGSAQQAQGGQQRESSVFLSSPPNVYSMPGSFPQSQPQQQQQHHALYSGKYEPQSQRVGSVFSDGEKSNASSNNVAGGRQGKKKSKKQARHGHGNANSGASNGFDGSAAAAGSEHVLQGRFQAAAGSGVAGGVYGGMHAGGSNPGSGFFITLTHRENFYDPCSIDDIISESASRRSTPTVPPGFAGKLPTGIPHLEDDGTTVTSRPGSRAGTPSIPPGFSGKVPTAVPAYLDDDGAISSRTRSRNASFSASVSASRPGTPSIPPGFPGKIPAVAVPAYLDVEVGVISRPSSRPGTPTATGTGRLGLKRQASQQVLPVVPLRPGTPRLASSSLSRATSPSRQADMKVEETPTKIGKGSRFGQILGADEEEVVKSEGENSEEREALNTVPAKSALVESGVEVKLSNATVVPRTPAAALVKLAAAVGDNVKKTTDIVTPVKKAPAQKAEPVVVSPPTVSKPERRVSGPPASMQPASKGSSTIQASDTKAAPVTPSKPESKKDEKRKQHPGKLDITAAVNKWDEATAAATKASTAEISTPTKQRNASQAASMLSVESPMVSSPGLKNAPRTIRVVQTPKAVTPPPQPLTSNFPPNFPGLAGRLPSRQPSIASINPPGTPSSEQVSISDNFSMTSTSVSRANSPPPGVGVSKVGSAPVRTKTKSQMKKERQERAKIIEEEKVSVGVEVVTPVADEPAQEAILSRKKKAKKEKDSKPVKIPKPVSTSDVPEAGPSKSQDLPVASGPATPAKKNTPLEPAKVPEETPSKPVTPTRTAPVHGPVPPPQMMPARNAEPSPPPTPTLTAASLLAELKSQAPEIQKCLESLFRAPNSAQYKANQPISPKDLQNPAFWKSDFKINLTKDEVDALLKGTIPAINYGGNGGRVWDRGMVTSTGAHLRALTEELETRFLELERALRELPEELRFRYAKPQNEIRFPGIDLEGLKKGFGVDGGDGRGGRGPSVMEQMVQDPNVLKKGAFLVDEAGRYVDEFVMPPVTPPPPQQPQQHQQQNAGARGNGQGQGSQGAVGQVDGQTGRLQNVDLEVVERQVQDARRFAEEGEGRLRKMIKRNRRLLGLG